MSEKTGKPPKGYSEYSYIGRMPGCGCLVCAMVDAADGNTRYKKDVAKEVASWIRDGLTVERVLHETVIGQFTLCTHHDKPKAGGKMLPGFAPDEPLTGG